MKHLAALALVSLALSCDKGGGTTPPPDATADVESTGADTGAGETEPADEGDDAAPVGAADHVAVADPPQDPPEDSGTDSGTDPAAQDGGDATGDPPAVSDGGETDPPKDPPKDKSPAKLAKLDLPKALHGKVDDKCGKDPGVGQKLKSFKLPRVEEGKTYSNGSFRGRVVLDAAGLPGKALVEATAESTVKQRVKDNTARAIAQGVFGVPSYLVPVGEGEVEGAVEVFWGQDSVPDLVRYLRGEDPIDREALARWTDLPAGATRKAAR